jgi:hypothetical protein
MTATNLPGCSRGQLPVRRACGDGNKPGVHAVGSVDFHAMFHRIVGAQHVLLQAESPEQQASFAGHRFADVEAGKRFLFEHDRLDSFPDQEHCCRRPPGSAANYEHIGFHVLRLLTITARKALASKGDLIFPVGHRSNFRSKRTHVRIPTVTDLHTRSESFEAMGRIGSGTGASSTTANGCRSAGAAFYCPLIIRTSSDLAPVFTSTVKTFPTPGA